MDTASGIASLMGISGLDTEAGLRVVGRRPDAYLRILARFMEIYGDVSPALASDSPRERLSAAAHSLRGACGSIGAIALASYAFALEQACNTGADADQLLMISAQVQQSLTMLVAQLHDRLG